MSVIDSFDYKDLDAQRVGRFDFGINTTFIVYRLNDTIIDAGPSNQWKYVKWFVKNKPFKQLVLTHHHEDHSGNAGAIYKLTGIQPKAPESTVEILKRGFRIPPLQLLIWGRAGIAEAAPLPKELRFAGEKVLAISAPGHAKDMTCYLMQDRGWIFTADLYVASHLKLLRKDESVPMLIHSIHKVLKYDFDTILCPHRGIVENGKSRLQAKCDYLLNLSSEARELDRQGLSLGEITRRLLGRENLLSLLSGYNFSKKNLIASCMRVDPSRFQE
ncbi:MBL fold metallo-hydrolase [Microbulbifer sp. OS29]|uniref:MBL fold metallo-hydrolase n=1 Tax=Microbulbifer okhotskensis TaxID=2926617 RepID=A0A9X2J5G4_9GAMM|nr:MBL fold metallo-hydrolase [Microbulbifer okhotskensis]MCO1335173.1 MBL fold metallo-hydrolase [Microbulbifer okhotskensis]